MGSLARTLKEKACPRCSAAFKCLSITSSACALTSKKSATLEAEKSDSTFWLNLHCPKCQEDSNMDRLSPAMIANQCEEESCKHTTRSPTFRLLGERERGTIFPNDPNCNGTLLRKYTEAYLYKQLSYFCHILDTQCSLEKMDVGVRIQVEKAMMKIRPAVESAAAISTRSMRDQCAYGWLQLTDLAT